MGEINVLKFQLNTTVNQLNPINPNGEDIEWTSSQGRYSVQLEVDNTIDFENISFILTDESGQEKELFGTELIKQEDTYNIYEGISYFPLLIKGNIIIKIGAQYTIEGITRKTEGIKVKIKEAISGNEPEIDIENATPTIKYWIELASKFNDAKAIEKIQTIRCEELSKFSEEEIEYLSNVPRPIIPNDNKKYCLLIYYKKAKPEDSEKATYVGMISIDEVEMELVAEYDGTVESGNGGGGKVGYLTELKGNKRGFSGGRQASTYDGAAVGFQAKSAYGFAGGKQAKSNYNNIAIGNNSTASTVKDNNIAIGTEAKIEDSGQAIVIGRNSKIVDSSRSVLIGGAGEKIDDENKVSTPSIFEQSKKTIGIGTRLTSNKGSYSILIGDNIANIRPVYEDTPQHTHFWSNISIGRDSVAPERGCIAIGPRSVAGAYRKPGEGAVESSYEVYPTSISSTELKDSDEKNNLGEPAAIAIGRAACAYGHASVSIGKLSVAARRNSIAIGNNAEAGPDYKSYSRLKSATDGNDGVEAIAIGYNAKAKANGAVQIGSGLNEIKNSLKFQDTPIVQNGCVQVNLNSGKGASGILALKNGGTGAKTALGARRNIGLVTGIVHREPTLDWGFKGGAITGRDFTFNFAKELEYKFTKAPRVFLSLRFPKNEQFSPLSINYYVKEITKDYFVVRVDYKPTDWDTTKKNATKLGIWFEVLAVGGSPEYVGSTKK